MVCCPVVAFPAVGSRRVLMIVRNRSVAALATEMGARGLDNATVVGNGWSNSSVQHPNDSSFIDWETVIKVRAVIWYSALALGIPGNILSAIVWLRLHFIGNKSSAIYLGALAVANLLYLLSRFLCVHVILSHTDILDGWLWHGVNYLAGSASFIQPLLLIGFSIERLIAILHPMLVRLTEV